ncbi:MAG: hypothetical protein Fur0018_16110 [Anaerolineales bacterium]
MDESDFSPLRIGFFGFGLMGGSLALALRPHCAEIHACDADAHTRTLAEGMVDSVCAHPADLLPRVDLLILAAPVRVNLRLLADLPRMWDAPLMLLDIGSTKRVVVEAMQSMPAHFDPLGGHPMCGKEVSGLAHADPDMFRGAPFAFVHLERTSSRLRSLAQNLAERIGARPLWLDAATHDRWVAATSHLPYLVATALKQATPAEAAPLIGPGFRSTTRLAASNPVMMGDILLTNCEPILQALARFREALDALEATLRMEEGGRSPTPNPRTAHP